MASEHIQGGKPANNIFNEIYLIDERTRWKRDSKKSKVT